METSDDSSKTIQVPSLSTVLAAATKDICFHLDSDGTILDHGGDGRSALLEAFLGEQLPGLLPPEVAIRFAAGLTQAVEGGETAAIEFDLPLTTERHTFEMRLIPFTSGKVVVIIRNISLCQREQVLEEALWQSEEHYRSLYNDIPVMLHSIDLDGRVIGVSNHWLEVLGYQRSEVVGRKSAEFLTEASRLYAQEVVLPEYYKTGVCKDVPYQIVTKGGDIIDVLLSATAERDHSGRITRSLAVMVDITERKRAEEALRESEDKFAKAFSATPTLLVISTLLEGRYIEVNDAFERIMGYRREEAIGRSSLDLDIWEHPEDRERMMKLLQNEGRIRDQEVNFKDKNGKILVGLFSAERVDLRGEPCLISLVNDITLRKRAEEKIEKLNIDLAARAAELEAANQELEAFNYTVAHDLRGPLNSMGLYFQTIQALYGAQLDETCRKYLTGGYEKVRRMNHLIDVLLAFSKLSHVEPHRESVDLSAVAREVAGELQHTSPERRTTFNIADGVMVEGDSKLLRIVLDNLIGNAWKYTGIREEAVIDFCVTDVDGEPVYLVRDNGAGFDEKDAAMLFIPFQRLHGPQQFKGFGIGLATVERIIRRHGGRIWAEGKPGKGATFYFTLGGKEDRDRNRHRQIPG